MLNNVAQLCSDKRARRTWVMWAGELTELLASWLDPTDKTSTKQTLLVLASVAAKSLYVLAANITVSSRQLALCYKHQPGQHVSICFTKITFTDTANVSWADNCRSSLLLR